MITRIWHGRTRVADAERYLKFLVDSGVKDYLATPGNLDVKIWREIKDDEAHFWTVSTWKDMESIKAFAGEPVEKAKYYPEDEEFLLEFEETVKHYETFEV